MNTYLGLDLGTSGLKLLLVTPDGEILAERTENYPVYYPHDGWSEQRPEDWVDALLRGLSAIFDGGTHRREDVKGVSFGGQMHGLVLLDADGNVLRPAILWNDGRTQKETDRLNQSVGKEKLSALTANIAFAGFTAPKILWVKEHEPEIFSRIHKICLPKDYLAYKMTGVFSTDYSDASGMLLLDVKNKCWSSEMCRICSVDPAWLPTLYESYEVTGRVLPDLGLPNAIVTAGAGDNAAAAIGTGTVKGGDCNISLGTSGTVFIAGDAFTVDPANALHSFAHANGRWHLMGCILSAASANRWWVEDILGVDYDTAVLGAETCLGDGNLYFLPYLMGERSPHNDVNARGAFIGMRPDTTRAEMSLAVLEGVAFALRDCVEVARAGGIEVTATKVCGGGAKSRLWRQILANVLGVTVSSLKTEQGPGFGAAMLAMVGAGEYPTAEAAAERIVSVSESIAPTPLLVEKYERKYTVFKSLYPALAAAFGQMAK